MSSLEKLSIIEILQLFKNNIIKFFDALIELLPKEGDLIILRVMFESQIPIDNALKLFASRIIPYRDLLKNRDERFFLECTDLFTGIRKDRVSYFKDLWASGALTKEDKDSLWRWFLLFLKLALEYEARTVPVQTMES
jgi:hypothetical protein